jgi:hypothetical protein
MGNQPKQRRGHASGAPGDRGGAFAPRFADVGCGRPKLGHGRSAEITSYGFPRPSVVQLPLRGSCLGCGAQQRCTADKRQEYDRRDDFGCCGQQHSEPQQLRVIG